MTKLEQAARQALDALEELLHSNSTKVAVEKYNTAHNALREALDHQADEIDWIETNKALAKEIIELKKQAEQEPVAWFVQYKNRYEFVFGSKPEFIVDGVVEPLYAAPVSIAKQSETDSSSSSMRTTVRTKDLTDDEIAQFWAVDGFYQTPTNFARAVIAADRELNK